MKYAVITSSEELKEMGLWNRFCEMKKKNPVKEQNLKKIYLNDTECEELYLKRNVSEDLLDGMVEVTEKSARSLIKMLESEKKKLVNIINE